MHLTWLIPLFPFLAFVAITLGAHRDKMTSRRLAVGAIVVSFVLAQVIFWKAVLPPVSGGDAVFESVVGWFLIGTAVFRASVWVDPLTAVMLFTVPLVCLLAFVYGAGYMREDPRYGHFFAHLSLLAAGTLGLIVSGNLLMLFLCWETLGLCSYLLIGLRFDDEAVYRAGLRAFLVTKVGDVFLLLGLCLLYAATGSLAYDDVFSAGTLARLARTSFPLIGGLSLPALPTIALLIFGAVVSQAAQFPLHVWLLDAVEGPTPASAIIQAVATAPAGVYLMARCSPLYTAVGGEVQTVMMAFGVFTALFGALTAIAQDDVRRVLACSTISQLGYAVAALSAGAYVAGVFHLVTHAFSKSLLILGMGSVTHGMKHSLLSQGEGVLFEPHDVKNMGGLARWQPVTCLAFVAGTLSLSGFPLFTTGFWSQERILEAAYETHHPAIFWALAVAAGLTAFYAARLLCLVFLGRPRSEVAASVQESERSMTAPLVVLAVLAVCLGWGGVLPDWFYRFVGDGYAAGAVYFTWQPLTISTVSALGGLLVGYLAYGRRPLRAGQMERLEAGMRRIRLGRLYDALRHCFYLDRFYQATFVRGTVALAHTCADFDRRVPDGAIGFVAGAGHAAAQAASRFGEAAIDGAVSLVARAGRAAVRAVDRFDEAVAKGAVNLTSRVGQAAAQAAVRFDETAVDGAANFIARMGQVTSQAADRFDALVIDRAVSLTGRALWVLSELSALLDPRVLTPLANVVGYAARTLSSASGLFDTRVVDGAVEGMGSAVRAGGRFIRPIQTGRVQNYILIAFISILVLVAMYFTMVYFAWW